MREENIVTILLEEWDNRPPNDIMVAARKKISTLVLLELADHLETRLMDYEIVMIGNVISANDELDYFLILESSNNQVFEDRQALVNLIQIFKSLEGSLQHCVEHYDKLPYEFKNKNPLDLLETKSKDIFKKIEEINEKLGSEIYNFAINKSELEDIRKVFCAVLYSILGKNDFKRFDSLLSYALEILKKYRGEFSKNTSNQIQ